MIPALEIDLWRDEAADLMWVHTRYRKAAAGTQEWTKELFHYEHARGIGFEPNKDQLLPRWSNPQRAFVVLLLRAEAAQKKKSNSQALTLNRQLVQALFDVVRHEPVVIDEWTWIQRMFETPKIRGPILLAQGGSGSRSKVSIGPELHKFKVSFYLLDSARKNTKSIIKRPEQMIKLAVEIEKQTPPPRTSATRTQTTSTLDSEGRFRDPTTLGPSVASRLPVPPPLTALESMFSGSGLVSVFRIPPHNFFRAQRVRAIITDEARQKKPRFCLLASSGRSYLHPAGVVWSDGGLREALKSKGAELNVVVQSPFSEFGHARALACNVRHHHWEESIAMRVLENKAKYPNVNLRVAQLPINCSLFITRSSVLYDPYLWACPAEEERIENHFWVWEFQPVGVDGRDSYSLLVRHFQFLFEHSLPLPKFLKLDGGHEKRTREFANKLRDPRYGSSRPRNR